MKEKMDNSKPNIKKQNLESSVIPNAKANLATWVKYLEYAKMDKRL